MHAWLVGYLGGLQIFFYEFHLHYTPRVVILVQTVFVGKFVVQFIFFKSAGNVTTHCLSTKWQSLSGFVLSLLKRNEHPYLLSPGV